MMGLTSWNQESSEGWCIKAILRIGIALVQAGWNGQGWGWNWGQGRVEWDQALFSNNGADMDSNGSKGVRRSAAMLCYAMQGNDAVLVLSFL